MWGNWSTTVRRTRLTPSYANTANLASDSIIYDPKYTSISTLQKTLAAHAATILHSPLPINTSTGTCAAIFNLCVGGLKARETLPLTWCGVVWCGVWHTQKKAVFASSL